LAKIALSVSLQKDNGTPIGQPISKTAPTHSAAKALVDAEVQARVDAAASASQDLLDAQAALNS
jgi:hypothetical protein